MRGYYAMSPWMGAVAATPPVTPPAQPSAPLPAKPSNDRGQYDQSSGQGPWTEAQRQAFQGSLAVGALGSVAGAVLWKEHRVWGFILGGMGGGAIGRLVFRPPMEFPWQRGRMT